MNEQERILVIDDDIELCELLTNYMQREEFAITTVHDSQQGLDMALSGEFTFVVLDVMLPGMNGFDVLRKIRSTSQVPILMLTARGDDVDRIVGLELGADDYMPKPFNPRELVARIRAIQRRNVGDRSGDTGGQKDPDTLTTVDVHIDLRTMTVEQNGVITALTGAEFLLLKELVLHAGEVVNRDDLAQRVLGRKLEMFDRSIDVHVSSLRKKLGHQVNGLERIKTVRGVGYLYAAI
ncbi:response regulator [Desulfogranum japonicum]|uniref:response regulator n=1 Tax=Desulfogranum japonicum TaxID=231447 RepID=UPI00041D64BF|nr:response regulator transcription factor [Desulfogranum japonicum]